MTSNEYYIGQMYIWSHTSTVIRQKKDLNDLFQKIVIY